MYKPLSRRTVLRGAGATIGLPFLEAMLGPNQSVAAPGDIPRRVIFFFTSCGVNQYKWWPTGGETNFTLGSSLAPLEPFRDKLIIPDNISMQSRVEDQRRNARNGHDLGTSGALTASLMLEGPSGVGEFDHILDGSAANHSIDQKIAKSMVGVTPYQSLAFGVDSNVNSKLYSRVSYKDAFEPVRPYQDPGDTFDTLFGNIKVDATTQLRRSRRAVVLDSIRNDLARLRSTLGQADRIKVDAHVSSVEEIMSRLDTVVSGSCTIPIREDGEDYAEKGRLNLDLMISSLACDLTRVALMQWSRGQSGTRFGFLGHVESHHAYSHYDENKKDSKGVLGSERIAEIDNWYAHQFAYLLEKLDSIEEGDGQSILDHTTVVWFNEQDSGIGNHHKGFRIPYILAGSGGGFFNTGRYIDLAGRAHGDLWVSIQQMMGLDDNVFGDPNFCDGAITELHA